MKNVNPLLKFWAVICLMVLCVASRNVLTGVFLMITMLILIVFAGRVSFRSYMYFMALPFSFLLLGGIALLFEAALAPIGVFNIKVFGFWLTVSDSTIARTVLVISRALGAVSCLCFLSLTTPMPDIIGVLHRVRCPDLIIDLMYLIYRYIFILLSMHQEMYNAAKSRLGFRDYRMSIRSTGKIYANLLGRSYQFAAKNFDAMESRCYDGGIRFLDRW